MSLRSSPLEILYHINFQVLLTLATRRVIGLAA
jgi:hypothetical protein